MRLPDGRIGRVRECAGGRCRVRVRRTTSMTHQFLELASTALTRVDCPRGWMSPEGYERYLSITLKKMRQRQAASRRAPEAAPPARANGGGTAAEREKGDARAH